MPIVLIFEALVQPGCREAFLNYSIQAQQELSHADGCLSAEQLLSVGEDRKVILKSTWKDEDALHRWQETCGQILEKRANMLALFERVTVSVLKTLVRTPHLSDAPFPQPSIQQRFPVGGAIA